MKEEYVMKVYDAKATCDKVFDLANKRGWSDCKLAQVLEVSPQAISKWRKGICSPSIDRLVMIADLFQVSMDDLLKQQEIEWSFNLE